MEAPVAAAVGHETSNATIAIGVGTPGVRFQAFSASVGAAWRAEMLPVRAGKPREEPNQGGGLALLQHWTWCLLLLHPPCLIYLHCFSVGAVGMFAGGCITMHLCAGACLALVLPFPFHHLLTAWKV